MSILLFELLRSYLNENPSVKYILISVLIMIGIIIFINIFSRFLQNLDYLSSSLKQHIKKLFSLLIRLIKLILLIVFMPFVFLRMLKEYKEINSSIINNSRYKDVS